MLPSTLLTTTHQRRHQHGSRSEKAYQELKRKIVTLELPPATVLTETVLMEDLGIGRTPVREALGKTHWLCTQERRWHVTTHCRIVLEVI